jgi:cold shock CspA family protein
MATGLVKFYNDAKGYGFISARMAGTIFLSTFQSAMRNLRLSKKGSAFASMRP